MLLLETEISELRGQLRGLEGGKERLEEGAGAGAGGEEAGAGAGEQEA